MRRHRFPLLVALLTFLTAGLYGLAWLGLTWSEMKHQIRDPKMFPLWHALSLMVPVYGLFRLHAQYRIINELIPRRNEAPAVNVIGMISAAAVAQGLYFASAWVSDGLFLFPWLASLILFGIVIGHGQRGLNMYRRIERDEVVSTGSRTWEWPLVGLGVLLFVTPIIDTAFLGYRSSKTYNVEGSGMLPNFHDGQRIRARDVNPSDLKRGDVIVFTFPNPSREFIKRVTGLPGDTIEIRRGTVFVNDEQLYESYATQQDTRTTGPVTIGEDSYYVLGDNRRSSLDSRDLGPVPAENLTGIVK